MLPPIIGDLQSLMVGLRAVPSDRERVDSSLEHKIPELHYADRSHALYSVVADWAVSWAGALQLAGPRHLANFDPRNRVRRMPSSLAAFTAASTTVSWLIEHHQQIKLHDESPRYALDITEAIAAEGRSLGYRPQPRRVPAKRCRACDSFTLRMHWPLDGKPTLRCTACGEVWKCGPQLTMTTLIGS